MIKGLYSRYGRFIINSRDICALIFSNKFIIILLFFPLFKTDGFRVVPYLAEICNILIAVEGLFFLMIAFISNKLSLFCKVIILFGIWSYIVAPLFSRNPMPSVFYITEAVAILTMLEVGFDYNYKCLLDALGSLFTIMIILNCILVILFPNGITIATGGEKLYLFGLRTGFSLFILPGIAVNLINDSLRQKKYFSVNTILCFVFGLLSLVRVWVATGIVELTILVMTYVYMVIFPKEKIFNVKVWCLAILLLNFCITMLGSSNFLLGIIAKLLNRDVTFTGRTYIWEQVMQKMQNSPFLGFGMNSTVDIYSVYKPAHNQWLQIALESGYIGLVIVLIALLFSFRQLYKMKKTKIYKIVTIAFIVILIGCIAEIQTYVPFLYMIFEIPFLLQNVMELNETVLPKRFADWR